MVEDTKSVKNAIEHRDTNYVQWMKMAKIYIEQKVEEISKNKAFIWRKLGIQYGQYFTVKRQKGNGRKFFDIISLHSEL